jgi:hypothetical protein
MSTLTPTAAKQIRRRLAGKDPMQAIRELTEECDGVLARVKASRARMAALPAKVVPGATKAQRKLTKDESEAAGKIAARRRAEQEGSPRCEWFTDGVRCTAYGTDCDHVLGGRWKSDMEALPNGEGFQVECRTHHDLKHGPGKEGHLAQAKEHAIRIGSRGLKRHIEAALARFKAKHPERREVRP